MYDELERLEDLVKALTVELMDYGGTNPFATTEVIFEEASDLYNLFGRARVLALCEHIHRSDIPVESARFQETFRLFNTKYFAGQLTEYEVLVVYDIGVWIGEVSWNPSAGYIDLEKRRIFIRLSPLRGSMESMLIHEMAYASADPSHGDKWINEMKRLKGLGAPVANWEFG